MCSNTPRSEEESDEEPPEYNMGGNDTDSSDSDYTRRVVAGSKKARVEQSRLTNVDIANLG